MPTYVASRDPSIGKIIDYLKKDSTRQASGRKVIFLCGGSNLFRRDRIKQIIKDRHADSFYIFHAEKVWDEMKKMEWINVLEMENYLAELADSVVIILESKGAICELGAFSQVESLRPKILVINNIDHINSSSFICTGPIDILFHHSEYKPLHFKYGKSLLGLTLDSFLSKPDDIQKLDNALIKIKLTKRTYDTSATAKDLQSLFFALLDIVRIAYPISKTELIALFKLAKTIRRIDRYINLLLSISISHDLIKEASIDHHTYYTPNIPGTPPIILEELRAEYHLHKAGDKRYNHVLKRLRAQT